MKERGGYQDSLLGFHELKEKRGQEGSMTGTGVVEQLPKDRQTPVAESAVVCFPEEASGDHCNLTDSQKQVT